MCAAPPSAGGPAAVSAVSFNPPAVICKLGSPCYTKVLTNVANKLKDGLEFRSLAKCKQSVVFYMGYAIRTFNTSM